ncbi:MAG: HU family DNA-binding protein [Bacteroidales bacterium]|nr:HU family DNA-binding protein [Bacteroidales bacterium]
MNMTDYLKDFFAEDASRKAAVPGLGVFYAEEGADGRYRILFEEVAPKGKEFINHVAFRMNATEQEAVEKLDEWVKSILKSLKSIKVATLPGIGTFEVSDDRVNFLPSAEQDKEDRFGLEPMTPAAPAVAEDAEDVVTPADLDEETRFADEMEQTEQLTGEHH